MPSVPISKLPTLVRETSEDFESRDITACHFGHVGDGNVHSLALFSNDEELERIRDGVHEMVERAIRLEGTCTGEHGVGIGKIEYLEKELGVGTVGLMETIKRTSECRVPHHSSRGRKLICSRPAQPDEPGQAVPQHPAAAIGPGCPSIYHLHAYHLGTTCHCHQDDWCWVVMGSAISGELRPSGRIFVTRLKQSCSSWSLSLHLSLHRNVSCTASPPVRGDDGRHPSRTAAHHDGTGTTGFQIPEVD